MSIIHSIRSFTNGINDNCYDEDDNEEEEEETGMFNTHRKTNGTDSLLPPVDLDSFKETPKCTTVPRCHNSIRQ